MSSSHQGSSNSNNNAPTLSKATSALSLNAPNTPANGGRTPTTVGFGPIGTPGAAPATTGVTIGDTMGGVGGLGFGLHEPPKMLKAINTGSGMSRSPMDGATTPTSSEQQSHSPSQSIRGTLNVKLIQARGLAVQKHADGEDPQPYVVMQFEQNEFVSRSPHPVSNPSHVPFTQSQPQPVQRATSGGLGSITRAFSDAIGRKKSNDGNRTPQPGDQQQSGSWFGKPGPGDPIWKEEVTL